MTHLRFSSMAALTALAVMTSGAALAQNKPEARLAFQQGALLERENRPGRDQVSKALERVQGTVRRVLNEARDKP